MFCTNENDRLLYILEYWTIKPNDTHKYSSIYSHLVKYFGTMQLFIDRHFRTFTKETYWKLSSPKRILFCFLKRILCSSFSPFLFCSIYSTDELVCIIHFSSVTFERVCSYVVTIPSSTTTMTYTVTAWMLSLKSVPLFFINLFVDEKIIKKSIHLHCQYFRVYTNRCLNSVRK